MSRRQFFEFFNEAGVQTGQKQLSMAFELIEPERFKSLAEAAGFLIDSVFGDYRRTPFCPATSPVMIWKLRRPDC